MQLLEKIEELITTESSIYLGELVEEAPDITCVLQLIPGRSPDLNLDGIYLRNPSFRVVIRDTSYVNAEARLETIIQTLTTSMTSSILGIYMEGDMIPIIDDKHTYKTLYCNFSVVICN